jgi:hypothetical protein
MSAASKACQQVLKRHAGGCGRCYTADGSFAQRDASQEARRERESESERVASDVLECVAEVARHQGSN